MAEKKVDLRGLKCPQLVLSALKSIGSKNKGEILQIQINDELAIHSIPNAAKDMGYQVKIQANTEKEWLITIE